jgi:IS30 family transposase
LEGGTERLESLPKRGWRYNNIIEVLSGLMVMRGCREFLCRDNGREFTANKLCHKLAAVDVNTAHIEPGSPWENGYSESSNAQMRDKFPNKKAFREMDEAQVLTKRRVEHYNTVMPHRSLKEQLPAPQTIVPRYA